MLRQDIIEPYLKAHPCPIVFVTVSGAHLYGFASARFDLEFHQRELARLHDELEAASENSSLPEEPTGRDALDDLLIRLRFARA